MPTILALVPHPDDESYAFGGLLALASREGWRCAILAASRGERGERHDSPECHDRPLADVRLAELDESARTLGCEVLPSLNLPDGDLGEHLDKLGRAIRRVVRLVDPTVVLTLGRDGVYGHPDHVALHLAAVESVREVPLFAAVFPPGLFRPQFERCLASGLFGNDPPDPAALGSPTADLRVDITAVVGRKLAAIAAHRTQLPGGDPHALFPPGIVAALLREERYEVLNSNLSTSAVRHLGALPRVQVVPPANNAAP